MHRVLRSLTMGLVVAGLTIGCAPTPDAPPPIEKVTRPKPKPEAKSEPRQDFAQSEPGATDADAPEEFTETATGLKYRILRKSEGRKPTAADTVLCHYKGMLDDGTVFDQTYDDSGEPIGFSLGGVIPGWTEGLQLIGEGGMIELKIPPALGYGAAGAGDAVPPNATLHFIVELLQIQ
ncbi:MAG: FKBP-type peptidyl-prolyl cis-trans isomerase [Planctomycetota bacterium]|jgi:FKBP-type peptidyl-prolyl cis-trans isomerase